MSNKQNDIIAEMRQEQMTACEKYSCQRFEQCDDCFMIDHLKVCTACEEYDHE